MLAAEKSKLILCAEAIKSLIFPYKYEQVYIPVLPKVLTDRVDAPFIFLLGVEKEIYYSEKL